MYVVPRYRTAESNTRYVNLARSRELTRYRSWFTLSRGGLGRIPYAKTQNSDLIGPLPATNTMLAPLLAWRYRQIPVLEWTERWKMINVVEKPSAAGWSCWVRIPKDGEEWCQDPKHHPHSPFFIILSDPPHFSFRRMAERLAFSNLPFALDELEERTRLGPGLAWRIKSNPLG